jgi:dihydrofolate reductase
MRKLIVLSFVTLDGVVQAPGLPEEDTSGGFKFGGWTEPYFDEFLNNVMSEQMGHPFDLLLGRITYDIFAAFWPQRTSETARALNKATKHVVSHKPLKSHWETTVHISGDVAGEIGKLKSGSGSELQVHGSGNLIQTLLKNDLVDELWLKTFPVVLGTGKKLFGDGAIPAGFRVEKTSVSPSGVVIADYRRAGEVKTGSSN